MSSKQPEDRLEFLVDRSLGSQIVPNALRVLGLTVHTLESVYGADAAQLPDDVWLCDAGRHGWLCLMKDKVLRRPANKKALCDNRAKAFCASSAQLTGEQYAERFVYNIRRILQRGARPGPFLYVVHAKTIVRICPPAGSLTRRQKKLLSRG